MGIAAGRGRPPNLRASENAWRTLCERMSEEMSQISCVGNRLSTGCERSRRCETRLDATPGRHKHARVTVASPEAHALTDAISSAVNGP